ncbi:MAG: hypothetical protein ACOYIP_00800 [Coriobacteriales bacterium]
MKPETTAGNSLGLATSVGEARRRIGRILFYTALVVYAFGFCFSKSAPVLESEEFEAACRVVMDIAVVCAMLKAVAFTRYRNSELLLMCVPIVAAVISLINSGFWNLVDILVFVMAAKDIDYDELCRNALIIWGAAIVTIMVLALIGTIDFRIGHEENTGLARYSFGFKRWTHFGAALMLLYMAYFKLRYERFNLLDYFGSAVFAVFLLFVVVSRSSAVLVVLFVLFRLLAGSSGQRARFFLWISLVLIVLVVVASFLFPLYYGLHSSPGEFANDLDSFLSSRLRYSYGVLATYPTSLFGQAVDYKETVIGFTYIDNTYVRLYASEGILSFACILALYILLLWHAYLNGDVALMILVTAVLVVGFAELTTIRLGRNLVLLALLPELERARGDGKGLLPRIENAIRSR